MLTVQSVYVSDERPPMIIVSILKRMMLKYGINLKTRQQKVRISPVVFYVDIRHECDCVLFVK